MNLPYYISWTAQQEAQTLPVKAAEDSCFVLEDGSRVVDFLSTSFQAHFGHSNERIVSSIKAQLATMPIASPKAIFSLKERVSEKLIELLRVQGGKIFYTVSGSESIENALKMLRQTSGKKKVLARRKSYHGATLGALSVTGDWRNEPHATVDEWTVRIPEPDDDPECRETREIIIASGPEDIAGFCLEPITGANGVIIPPQSWWEGIKKLCDEFGLALIVDEVLTGFGRTGTPFAFQHFGLSPDFVVMSKGITGGYIPFGAVWTNPRVADYYEKNVLSCGLTNYAHPLGLAALEAVIELLNDETFRSSVAALETSFREGLSQLQSLQTVTKVRSKGLLAAIEFTDDVQITFRQCIEAGLYLLVKPGMLVLSPPLTMESSLCRECFQKIGTLLGGGKVNE